MPNIVLKKPNAPATQKQIFAIRKLTGENVSDLNLTMQQASDMIAKYEVNSMIDAPKDNGVLPFNEAHVTIIEADQGGGKSCTATGMVVDAYYIDCIKIYCDKYAIDGIVKGYDRKNRIARLKHNGKVKLIRIPQKYKLHSPLRIFSNYHLYGIPYVWIQDFGHLLQWMKMGLITNGWLLIDEAYVGANARDSMTSFGKEMEKQSFQMRKMQLEVVIITPHARLIDKWLRVVPTKHIMCAYDKKKHEITLTIREKGKKGNRTLPPFDASQYFPHFWTNERINK